MTHAVASHSARQAILAIDPTNVCLLALAHTD